VRTDGGHSTRDTEQKLVSGIIGKVDHHGNGTELKHVGNGLIEVHSDNQFVGHVHLEQIVELVDRSVDTDKRRSEGGEQTDG
jgi:Na+/H+ antiporter NhaB